MKARGVIFLLIVILGISSSCAGGRPKFCVRPGDRIELLLANCSDIKLVYEYTEAGKVTSYVVSSAGYMATVEPEGDVIEVIRFRQNPLPVYGVSIGDRFKNVRANKKSMKLVSGVGEDEYLALADEARGVYIAFDVSGLPPDWQSSAINEATLSEARVIALNLVLPR